MRVQLFTGKGGVGKTTLAAATAARLAADGRKVLVLSTDPAHSLGDVLGVALGPEPTEVDHGLFAAEVDPLRLVDGAWASLRSNLAVLLAGAGVDEMAAEELTVLPGVEELLALAEVHDLARGGPWEVVLVDCAPTAETLRLLALPSAVLAYVERLFPAHQRMVLGLAGSRGTVNRWQDAADALSRLAERLDRLRAMLTDPAVTGVLLVLTPERVVVTEVRRTLTALALMGIRVEALVANRLVPSFDDVDLQPALKAAVDRGAAALCGGAAVVHEGVAGDGCGAPSRGAAASWLHARRAEQDAVLARLEASGTGIALHTVPHMAAEPIGLAALAELGTGLDVSALEHDPPGDVAGLLQVKRTAGTGRDLDSEFELRVALPGASPVELSRVGDELAITLDGRRQLVVLPSVLRRCSVTHATQDGSGLSVLFRPDPDVWMR